MPYPSYELVSHDDLKRGLRLPEKYSVELAEIFGVMTGDGCLNRYGKYGRSIIISGDSRHELDYFTNHLVPIIESLFNLTPSMVRSSRDNGLYLYLHSKGLYKYLITLGFPAGKKGQIRIPGWILGDDELLAGFIRGFADTDGSFHLRRGRYPIISFSSISRPLMASLFVVLYDFGFNLSNYYEEKRFDKRNGRRWVMYTIYLYGLKNLSPWMNKIGFRNRKHLDKIDDFLQKSGSGGI